MSSFLDTLKKSSRLAVISTAVGQQPSSRLMGFAYDEAVPNVWYFFSKPNTTKVAELQKNSRVAVMTLLTDDMSRIESNQARMIVSDKTWQDVAEFFGSHEVFLKNHPHPDEEVMYELHLDAAQVAVGMKFEAVTF